MNLGGGIGFKKRSRAAVGPPVVAANAEEPPLTYVGGGSVLAAAGPGPRSVQTPRRSGNRLDPRVCRPHDAANSALIVEIVSKRARRSALLQVSGLLKAGFLENC